MDKDIIAINILLEPDKHMSDVSKVYNNRLLKNYSAGFQFGEHLVPHITVFQLYVKTKDLSRIEKDLSLLVGESHLSELELKANHLYYSSYNEVVSVALGIDKRPLMRFHNRVCELVTSYKLSRGNAMAFAPRADGKAVSEISVNYVASFEKNSGGMNYLPHLTLGIADKPFAENLKSEPFEEFCFKLRSVSICQIGEFGTAQNRVLSIWL